MKLPRSASGPVEEVLSFPPTRKLGVFGKLDPEKATEAELRGEESFSGKGRCAECHQAPYYTDNLMHNLMAERFFEPQMVNGRMASADGAIKTFPLRGIRHSPPYLHDGRLLTLEDTVEFHNLVLVTKLTDDEKSDLARHPCDVCEIAISGNLKLLAPTQSTSEGELPWQAKN